MSFVISKKKKLLAISRGYRRLVKQGKLSFLRELKSQITVSEITKGYQLLDNWFFGKLSISPELIIRQYALQRNYNGLLNEKILLNLYDKNKQVTYPLPVAWQKKLIHNNIGVNHFGSSLLWYWQALIHLFYGYWLVFRLPFDSFLNNSVPPENYVFLDSLSKNNVPISGKDYNHMDICSWMAKWHEEEINAICHNVKGSAEINYAGKKIQYLPEPYRLSCKMSSTIFVLLKGTVDFFLALFLLLFRKWQYAFLFPEVIKASYTRFLPSESFAHSYLFHNSGTVYQPLWSHVASLKGSLIVCYFYSTFDQVKTPAGYQSQIFEFGAESWPTYMVWDDYQMSNIQANTFHNPEFVVTGPISFVGTETKLPELPYNAIAVFDLEPHRKLSHYGTSTLAEYDLACPGLVRSFILDILKALSITGSTMVVKRKRDIGSRSPKWYQKLLLDLATMDNVVILDPAISADEVVKGCLASISFPFTSTALIGKECSKSAVFYDPSGWIQKDDRGAHGLPVLSGFIELEAWVKDLITSNHEELLIKPV